MVRTGILTVGPSTSRLDGVLLAVKGGTPNPLAAATNFLQGSGFVTGNRARVTGTPGTIGTQAVIFMTRVEHAMASNTVARFLKASAATTGVSRVSASRNRRPASHRNRSARGRS